MALTYKKICVAEFMYQDILTRWELADIVSHSDQHPSTFHMVASFNMNLNNINVHTSKKWNDNFHNYVKNANSGQRFSM